MKRFDKIAITETASEDAFQSPWIAQIVIACESWERRITRENHFVVGPMVMSPESWKSSLVDIKALYAPNFWFEK
jgi:hypothetical protein